MELGLVLLGLGKGEHCCTSHVASGIASSLLIKTWCALCVLAHGLLLYHHGPFQVGRTSLSRWGWGQPSEMLERSLDWPVGERAWEVSWRRHDQEVTSVQHRGEAWGLWESSLEMTLIQQKAGSRTASCSPKRVGWSLLLPTLSLCPHL